MLRNLERISRENYEIFVWWKMPKTLDITRILREQKKQLRAGFQDRLVMTTSIPLRIRLLNFRFANFLEKVLEGIIFCFVRRAKTSSVARLFGTLQKSATENFQDRLVVTASHTLHRRGELACKRRAWVFSSLTRYSWWCISAHILI